MLRIRKTRWKIASRPVAGFVIGAYLALTVANGMFEVATGASESVFMDVLGAVGGASLALLYVRSSVRLHREPPRIVRQQTVPDPPRWKPIRG